MKITQNFNNLNIYKTIKRNQKSNYNNFSTTPAQITLNKNCVSIPNELSNNIPLLQFNQISFSSKRITTSNFEIKNIKNLRCPICGKIMLNEEQELEFAKEICSKTGEKLKEAIEFYEDERNITQDWENGEQKTIYRKNRKEVVEIIKKLALENPKLHLHQLVALHAKPILQNLIVSQLKIIEELNDFACENFDNTYELLDFIETLSEYTEIIKGNDDLPFSTANFLKDISRVTRNKEHQKQINKIAQKMPTPKRPVEIFFIKSKKNKTCASKRIAKNILHQAGITVEHLKPKSKNGKDRASNYICDCADCNASRGSKPFDIWISEIPNFEQNLKNYLLEVQKAMDNGTISQDLNYIPDVIETIKTLSNGKINIEQNP